jgi:hypothetical protein
VLAKSKDERIKSNQIKTSDPDTSDDLPDAMPDAELVKNHVKNTSYVVSRK